jgi:hypothetical protein
MAFREFVVFKQSGQVAPAKPYMPGRKSRSASQNAWRADAARAQLTAAAAAATFGPGDVICGICGNFCYRKF